MYAAFPRCRAGGSTGFGRAYRNRLRGSWGVVDVADVCAAAAHLAGQGSVDPDKLTIDGGSAGGYTTLAALAFRWVGGWVGGTAAAAAV
jgi:dipeptidyl aminopeptidase/acylaminoacyl peptidase